MTVIATQEKFIIDRSEGEVTMQFRCIAICSTTLSVMLYLIYYPRIWISLIILSVLFSISGRSLFSSFNLNIRVKYLVGSECTSFVTVASHKLLHTICMFEYTEILNCHQTCQFDDSMSKLATRKENI
jgi:hypothetical protein